jgi:copper chaperone
MKKALAGAGAVLLAAIVGVFLLSSEKKAESAVIVADIAVEGMSCQNCADKVDAALSQLDGVKAVEVRLADRVAQVKYDAALVTIPALEQSITKLGYGVGKTGAVSGGCEEEASDVCCAAKNSKPKT